MSNNYKILSIDESGKASYKHQSKLFILSAVLIDENYSKKLDLQIRKLKKKYLKNENIVFHSRDMYRRKGPFSIFSDQKVEINFWSELLSILNTQKISFIFIITNKQKAKKLGWQPKTILQKSFFRLLELFLIKLTKDQSLGRIIAESDTNQDKLLIFAHVKHQNQNLSYRNSVTSLSLVTKANQDASIQIADALGAIAGMYTIQTKAKNRIEQIKVRLIERKLKDPINPSYLEMLL